MALKYFLRVVKVVEVGIVLFHYLLERGIFNHMSIAEELANFLYLQSGS